jgi:hypothetical protein
MFLQILRTLECLSTEITFVWLQWDVDADVGGDVVTLDGGGAARVPATGEVKVVCALSSDVLLANMVLGRTLALILPETRTKARMGNNNNNNNNLQRGPRRTSIVRSTCPIGTPDCHRPQCSVWRRRPLRWWPGPAAVPARGQTSRGVLRGGWPIGGRRLRRAARTRK